MSARQVTFLLCLFGTVVLAACDDEGGQSSSDVSVDGTSDATNVPDSTIGDASAPPSDTSVPPSDTATADGANDAASDGTAVDATSDMSVPPVDSDALFVSLPANGEIAVTLHPGDVVGFGLATRVAFGVPFPRGLVSDASEIRLTLNQSEIPSAVVETNRWRSLSGDTSVDSVRSALVFADITFATLDPIAVTVEYGVPRTQELDLQGESDPTANWVPIAQSAVFPDEYDATEGIAEPSVYATFSPDWLGMCLLRTRTVPFGSDQAWDWFDGSVPEYAATAVNDVGTAVTTDQLIDYENANAPWLFDRPMTLFGVYIRSGDVRWLRHAHRATQFYKNHVAGDGTFDLRPGDLKYAYGEAMLLDWMLTGDASNLGPIEDVASAGAGWNESYTFGTNFWTERHQTYALLAALSAWEATGASSHAARVEEIVSASLSLTQNPVNGWTNDGCMLHTMAAHEGTTSQDPICSPWMSALFADAMWRVYLHSEDDRALELLAALGDFVATNGSYVATDAGELTGLTLPWYLSSSVTTSGDPWSDVEHTCDVAGLVAKAAWSRAALGGDASSLWALRDSLLVGCEWSLDYWYRPGSDISAGRPEWRLAPPRKFNWWFGTTSDLTWLAQ